MIVASIFAPRYEKWEGCDYDDMLALLQDSCDRLGIRHICISDSYRPNCETFRCDLPENLMQLLIDGQRQFMLQCDEPILFTGADCILTANPAPLLDADVDLHVTCSSDHKRLNTGFMLVRDGRVCAPIWADALKRNPVQWGEDQTTLLDAMQASNLRIKYLSKGAYNRPPLIEGEPGNEAMIVHFKGRRKKDMRPWYERWSGRAQGMAFNTVYRAA